MPDNSVLFALGPDLGATSRRAAPRIRRQRSTVPALRPAATDRSSEAVLPLRCGLALKDGIGAIASHTQPSRQLETARPLIHAKCFGLAVTSGNSATQRGRRDDQVTVVDRDSFSLTVGPNMRRLVEHVVRHRQEFRVSAELLKVRNLSDLALGTKPSQYLKARHLRECELTAGSQVLTAQTGDLGRSRGCRPDDVGDCAGI